MVNRSHRHLVLVSAPARGRRSRPPSGEKTLEAAGSSLQASALDASGNLDEDQSPPVYEMGSRPTDHQQSAGSTPPS